MGAPVYVTWDLLTKQHCLNVAVLMRDSPSMVEGAGAVLLFFDGTALVLFLACFTCGGVGPVTDGFEGHSLWS